MDFTRQPIIETIITPREGFRLVIRSSKNMGQEELFVDALEVVSFGAATLFFRSTERPKPFLVPASDYEVLEVREQRLVLKTPSSQPQENSAPRQMRQQNDRQAERRESERGAGRPSPQEPKSLGAGEERSQGETREQLGSRQEPKGRGRDRHRRRRGDRGSDRGGLPREGALSDQEMPYDQETRAAQEGGESGPESMPRAARNVPQASPEAVEPPPLFRTILPPPQTLIRDDLQRLRDSEVYRGAFFIREEKEGAGLDDDDASLQSIDADSEMHIQVKKEAPPQGESFRPSEEYAAEVHSNPPIPLP